MNRNQMMKKDKGITLVALAITVIVLIILAGVTINTLTGDNNIINNSSDVKKQAEIEDVKEQAKLDITNWKMEQLENREDIELDDDIVKNILLTPTLKDYIKEINGYTVITENGYEIPIYELYNGNLYQEVEWIESSGTQYINTGIIPNENMKFEVDVALYEHSTTTYVFGSDTNYYTGYNMGIDWTIASTEGIRGMFGGYAPNERRDYMILSKVNPTEGIRYNISLSKNQIRVGDTVVTNAQNWAGVVVNWPIIIFGTNRNGEAAVLKKIRVYSFRVYENGEVIQHLVPCYRKTDNAIGMYDVVNDEFHANEGTGEFLKGQNVND